MATGWFVAENDLHLRFGGLETTISSGTTISPADTLVARIIQSVSGAEWHARRLEFWNGL